MASRERRSGGKVMERIAGMSGGEFLDTLGRVRKAKQEQSEASLLAQRSGHNDRELDDILTEAGFLEPGDDFPAGPAPRMADLAEEVLRDMQARVTRQGGRKSKAERSGKARRSDAASVQTGSAAAPVPAPPMAAASSRRNQTIFAPGPLGVSSARAFLAAELLGPPVSLRDGWFNRPDVDAPRQAAEDAARVAVPVAEQAPAAGAELTPEALFRLAMQEVLCDGKLSAREVVFFRSLRQLLGVPEAHEKRILEEEKARILDGKPAAGREADSVLLYRRALDIARRDREVTEDERKLLEQLAQLLGLSPAQRAAADRD